jgi:hypothetical protein
MALLYELLYELMDKIDELEEFLTAARAGFQE